MEFMSLYHGSYLSPIIDEYFRYQLLMTRVDEISSVEEKVNNLLNVLKDIGLDFNWLLGIVSLSAQEIAIKKKLDELGESYGEEDFQKLADKLIKSMEERIKHRVFLSGLKSML